MSEITKSIQGKFTESRGIGILLLLSVAGLLMYIGGIAYDTFATPDLPTTFFEKIAIGIGSLILVSGISGAIIKILAVEGFFLDAVSQSAFGIQGLQRIKDKSLMDVWVNANNLLHFKKMNNEQLGDIEKQDIETLRQELSNQIRTNFDESSAHFVFKHSRTLKIEWHNKKEKIILIKDTTNSELIPFDPSTQLKWTVNMNSETGVEIQDDTVQDIEFKLIGENTGTIRKEIELTENKLQRTTTFISSAKPRHEIFRKREWRFNVLNDPNLFTISPCYVQNSDATIENCAKGLRVVVLWLGNDELFEIIEGEKQIECDSVTQIRLKQPVLLPNQGYCLSFITV